MEIKVLGLLARGYLIKEVAGIFKRSKNSVNDTMARTRKKLFVPSYINSQTILPLLALHTDRLERIPEIPAELTHRRICILRHVTSGLTQAQTAKALGLSRVTIERHMAKIRSIVARELCLDNVNNVELTHYAIARGITPIKKSYVGLFSNKIPFPCAASG